MSEIDGIEKINPNAVVTYKQQNAISESLGVKYSENESGKSVNTSTFNSQKSDSRNEIRCASEVLSEISKVKDSVSSIEERFLKLKEHIEQPDVSTCWRNYRSYIEQEMQWLKGKTDSEDHNFDEPLSEDRKRLLQIETNSV